MEHGDLGSNRHDLLGGHRNRRHVYLSAQSEPAERPDQALPWLVMNVLPPWLAALVVVAVVAGMSSAANGNAAAAGTFFVRHIYPLVTGRAANSR